MMLYEFKADLRAYFSTVSPELGMRTREELIAFNEANADREMPYFGQEILIAANEMGALTDPEYLGFKETARRLSQEEDIDRLMEEHQLDAIVASSTRAAWKTDQLAYSYEHARLLLRLDDDALRGIHPGFPSGIRVTEPQAGPHRHDPDRAVRDLLLEPLPQPPLNPSSAQRKE